MANVKISNLPASGAITGTELLAVVQGGVTKKAAVSALTINVATQATGILTSAHGGTGQDMSASTGVVHVSGGVFSATAVDLSTADVTGILGSNEGGTGQDLSAATGVVKVTAGAFSAAAVDLGTADVTGTLPGANMQASSGGNSGSMSAADKTKLDGIQNQGASVAIPGGNNIDWSLAGIFYQTLALGATTFTFSNDTDGWIIAVRLTSDPGGSTVTWPGGIFWPGGTPPTQTATGTDVLTFLKDASGIYGTFVQNFS